MKSSKLILLFSFCILALGQIFAQTKYVNEFLNIGVGAKGHGMFNAQIASVDDVSAGFWNPAGLGRMSSNFQVGAMHAEWFAGIANYDYLGIAKQINEKSQAHVSLNIVRMGVDNIPNTLELIAPDGSVNYDRVVQFSAADYAVMGSYGQKVGQFWSVGGTAKVIRRVLSSFGSSWGFGTDFGLQYQRKNYSVGVMAKDLTTTYNAWTFNLTESQAAVFKSTGNTVPTSSTELTLPRLIVGFAYHSDKSNLSRKFHYHVETNISINTDGRASGLITNKNIAIEPTLGAEVSYKHLVFLRGGIGNLQRLVNDFNADKRSFSFVPSLGLGLKMNRLRIDYALNTLGAQGSNKSTLYTHIISLNLDIQPVANKK